MLDLWLPQGTHIDETVAQVAEIERYLGEFDEVAHVTSLIGQGGLRFLLTYTPEKLNGAYAQLLVDVEDYRSIARIGPIIERELQAKYPDMLSYYSAFQLGPGSTAKSRRGFLVPISRFLRRSCGTD